MERTDEDTEMPDGGRVDGLPSSPESALEPSSSDTLNDRFSSSIFGM